MTNDFEHSSLHRWIDREWQKHWIIEHEIQEAEIVECEDDQKEVAQDDLRLTKNTQGGQLDAGEY